MKEFEVNHASRRANRAQVLYEKALQLSSQAVPTQGGVFGADMKVELVNDGPVTLLLEV